MIIFNLEVESKNNKSSKPSNAWCWISLILLPFNYLQTRIYFIYIRNLLNLLILCYITKLKLLINKRICCNVTHQLLWSVVAVNITNANIISHFEPNMHVRHKIFRFLHLFDIKTIFIKLLLLDRNCLRLVFKTQFKFISFDSLNNYLVKTNVNELV